MCSVTQWVVLFGRHATHKVAGDLSTGTAGMFVDRCPMLSPAETGGCSGGMLVTFNVLGEGLPIPGIDFFEDFPLLTLAVLASFELVNSL